MTTEAPLEGTLILADETDQNLGGRPRLYSSPEEFNDRVDRLLEEHAVMRKPLTLTRLVLGMGFSSIQAFNNYRGYEGFLEPVERARLIVMAHYEDAVILGKNTPAHKVLSAMDSQTFNPEIKVGGGTEIPHEDRLKHLK